MRTTYSKALADIVRAERAVVNQVDTLMYGRGEAFRTQHALYARMAERGLSFPERAPQ